MTTVGIVSPGAMGSAIGRVLLDGWIAGSSRPTAGRSERTQLLAEGLELLPTLGGRGGRVRHRPLGRPARRGLARSRTQSPRPPRRPARTPLVADLNAIAPATDARHCGAPRGRRARGRRRLDLRPASAARRDDRSSTSPAPRRSASPGFPRPGSSCASSARPSGRPRRSRCRPRRSTRARRRSSRRRSAQLGRTACSTSCSTTCGRNYPDLVDDVAAHAPEHRGEVRPLRRRDARRSRRSQEAAGLTPDLFAAFAEVYRRAERVGSRGPCAGGGRFLGGSRRRARLARMSASHA